MHATYFNTPRLFVNVRFLPSEPQGDCFVAGKPTEPAATNRVLALVRFSTARTKEDFDKLAVKIQDAWNDIVGFNTEPHEITDEDRMLKMHMVGFTVVLAVRENGVTLPSVR